MSMHARHEWQDQQALVSEQVRGFLANPGEEQLKATIAELQAYAEAAQNGKIEIPQCWINT